MPLLEVFADVCCPFAHVGLRRITAMRSDLGRDDVILSVRAWPLELVNGVPLDRDLVEEHVQDLRGSVAADLFVGFDVAALPDSSLPALDLAAAANVIGAGVGESVSLALRTALFEHGQDISDPEVLAAIAREHGVGAVPEGARDLVLADWHDGTRRGVRGSPEFFVGSRGYFCPALEIENVAGHLEIHFDDAGFEAFMADCFAG